MNESFYPTRLAILFFEISFLLFAVVFMVAFYVFCFGVRAKIGQIVYWVALIMFGNLCFVLFDVSIWVFWFLLNVFNWESAPSNY